MLIHQHFESEGAGSDGVNLTNRTVFGEDFGFKGSAYAGVEFDGTSGILQIVTETNGRQNVIGEWLLQGNPADFYLRYNIEPGDTLDVATGTENTWIQMNSDLEYSIFVAIMGTQTATVLFEISSDVSGTPIIETAEHNYNVLVGGF